MNIFNICCEYDAKTRLKEYERLNRCIRRNVDFVTKLGLKPLNYESLKKPLEYRGSILSVFHSNARITLQSKGLLSTIAMLEGDMMLKKGRFNNQGIIECVNANVLFFKRKEDSLVELAHNHVSYSSVKRNTFHVETDKTFLLDSYGEYIVENFRE
jgi:hypothetical protein